MNCKFIHKNMFRHRCLYRGKKIFKKSKSSLKDDELRGHPKEMGFVDIIILSICEQKPLAEGRSLHVWAYHSYPIISGKSGHTPLIMWFSTFWNEGCMFSQIKLSFIWASNAHCLNQSQPGIIFKHHWRRSRVGWTLASRFPFNYRMADGKSVKF